MASVTFGEEGFMLGSCEMVVQMSSEHFFAK